MNEYLQWIDPARFSPKIRFFIFIAIFLITLLLGFVSLFRQPIHQLYRLKQDQMTLKKQYIQINHQIRNLPAYNAQLEIVNAELKKIFPQLPTSDQMPRLTDNLVWEAAKNDLRFDSLQKPPEISQGFYTEFPVNLTLQGDYYHMASYLNALIQSIAIIQVKQFSIELPEGASVTDPTKKERLILKLSLRLYQLNSQPGMPTHHD